MMGGVEAVRENQGGAAGASGAAGDGRDGEKEDEADAAKGGGLKTTGEREDDVLLELLGLDGDEGGRSGGGGGGGEAEEEEGELALLDSNAREF